MTLSEILYRPLLVVAFLFPFLLSAEAEFAFVSRLVHACNGEGGSIFVEINGNPDDFTYGWAHGPTTQELNNVAPGTYYFYILNAFGCSETLEVQVLDLSSCYYEVEVVTPVLKDDCKAKLTVTVFSGDGTPIPPESVRVVWDGNIPPGNEAIVDLPLFFRGVSICFDYYVSGGGGDFCCTGTGCVSLPRAPRECSFVDPKPEEGRKEKLIVNEFNRGKDGENQYLELLVVGNGACGERK